jgi:citrate synthase
LAECEKQLAEQINDNNTLITRRNMINDMYEECLKEKIKYVEIYNGLSKENRELKEEIKRSEEKFRKDAEEHLQIHLHELMKKDNEIRDLKLNLDALKVVCTDLEQTLAAEGRYTLRSRNPAIVAKKKN